VPYLNSGIEHRRMEDISTVLDHLERHTIQKLPWPEFSYRPDVSFSIAHTDNRILLKYFVREKAIRVLHHEDNSPVHEDSCVEFFIAFDDDEEYYNLEFNCAGTCLLGFGKNSAQRSLVGVDVIRQIKRYSAINNSLNGSNDAFSWELAVMIPAEVFVHHKIDSLKGKRYRVNFYKCGDKLPQPHFLSWQDMKTASPDFHLTEFFGEAYFR
jgi:Carbohydrate-binding family 9